MQTRDIVLYGSASFSKNNRNSSTVMLRGFRIVFVASLISTNSIGLTSLGTISAYMANFHRREITPLMCTRLFGASGKDLSHRSTGRAFNSVNGRSPHAGRM